MIKFVALIAAVIVFKGSIVHGQIAFSKFQGIEEALSTSLNSNKPIFVDTYTDWCGWCKHMDKQIFSDQDVASYFNENFICLKIDGDAESSSEFISKYEVAGYPCLLILDAEGTILNRSDGAITDIEEFIAFGEKAYYKLFPESSPWKKNEIAYLEGNRDPNFLKEFALSMVDGGYAQEEIDKVIDEFWKAADVGDIDEMDKLDMIYNFHYGFDDKHFDYFLDQKNAVIEMFGEEYYYAKMIEAIVNNLDDALLTDDENLYNRTVKFAKQQFKDQTLIPLDELMDYIITTWDER